MKDDKRLTAILVGSVVLNVLFLFVIFALGSYQIAQVRSIALETQRQVANIPQPRDGMDGRIETIVTHLPSRDGADGKDAAPPTDSQVDAAVDRYMALHPVKDGESIQGPKGDPGERSLVLFVRQTLLGDLQCRYGTDSGWSPIEECSE